MIALEVISHKDEKGNFLGEEYNVICIDPPYNWNPYERTVYGFNEDNMETLKDMFTHERLLQILCRPGSTRELFPNFVGTDGELMYAYTGDQSGMDAEKADGVIHRHVKL